MLELVDHPPGAFGEVGEEEETIGSGGAEFGGAPRALGAGEMEFKAPTGDGWVCSRFSAGLVGACCRCPSGDPAGDAKCIDEFGGGETFGIPCELGLGRLF